MITLFIIATIIILAYPIYFKLRYDVPSISESYYILEVIKKGLGLIFTGWCVAPAFLLFPIWVEIMPEQWQFIAFLNVIALGAVGCAPRFKSFQEVQHYVFAVIAVLLSIGSAIILNLWVIPLFLVIPTLILSIKKIDKIFWVEMAALVSILLLISLNLL